MLQFRQFSGHAKLNLSQHLGGSGGTAPRPLLSDSPITSVSGPGITMFLVTPLAVLSHMRILPVGYPISYVYTCTGCLYAYGMPIRIWDDIFTEVLSYYKRLNLAHNSSIEVQTHRNRIILQNNKYFYRCLICRIVLMLAI